MLNKTNIKKPLKTTVILFLLILTTLYILLPTVAKFVINKKLSSSLENYTAKIEDLEISILKGKYTIKNLVVDKKGSSSRPLIKLKNLEVYLDSRLLLKNMQFVLDIVAEGGAVVLVNSKDNNEKQLALETEKNTHWTKALKSLIPLSVSEFTLKKVTVEFENKDLRGLEHNKLNIEKLVLHHLLDPEEMNNGLSPINFSAKLNEHSKLLAGGGIDVTKKKPKVDIDVKLEEFKLVTVNKLLRHYVPMDVNKGSLTIFAELKGDIDSANGYLRTFFTDLDIIKINEEFKTGKGFLIEIASGFGNWILDSLTGGNVATEIPFSINEGEFKLDTSAAFWNSLENLFDKTKPQFKKL